MNSKTMYLMNKTLNFKTKLEMKRMDTAPKLFKACTMEQIIIYVKTKQKVHLELRKTWVIM